MSKEKKKLTQDELVRAFNQYMPKRHVFPPLVDDEDDLTNSSTESEGSDTEEDDPFKKLFLSIDFSTVMTLDCEQAYAESTRLKRPEEYLNITVKKDLEMALEKLINLTVKPKDPIDWLGYTLLNMQINKHPKPNSYSGRRKTNLLTKPVDEQLQFEVNMAMDIGHSFLQPSLFREPVDKELQVVEKRRLPAQE
uniref:Uncharacterized protein n=1 Tax=Caenorhabditis japonica TaxID=281687 RepID=A0A8R1DZ34_CAEJA